MGAEQRAEENEASAETEATDAAQPARLVYTQAPVLLGRLEERLEGGRWRARVGAVSRELAVDPAVDPALLEEALELGARVIVETEPEPTVVGVVAVRRALAVQPDGSVQAKVRALKVEAEDEILLKVPGAFLRTKAREVEVYGDRVVTRARNLAKILAAMIKLN